VVTGTLRRGVQVAKQRHYTARGVDAVVTIAWISALTRLVTTYHSWSVESVSFALSLPLVPLSVYWLWFSAGA